MILRRFASMSGAMAALLAAAPAHASLFSGETLDPVANVLAWVVLFIAPVIAITVFWLVHILPEKIAEKRQHPQANAIKTLCLLSLFFGGMLWPLAWLWAYSKPVLYTRWPTAPTSWCTAEHADGGGGGRGRQAEAHTDTIARQEA